MTPFRRLLIALALPVLLAPSWGAELVVRDLQAGVMALPTDYHFTLRSPTSSVTGDDGFSSSGGLEIGGRRSLARPGDALGLVAGLDLDLRHAQGGSSSLDSASARGSLGVGWAVTDDWNLVLAGGVGFGEGRVTFDATAFYPEYAAAGRTWSVDGRLALGYRFSENWRVTGFVGYERATARFSSNGADLDLSQSGTVVGLGVSWILSSAPALLK